MNTAETPSRSNHDDYWKEAFDRFLPGLLAFFAPAVADAIDWSRGFELITHGLSPDALHGKTGTRYPDRVYKVLLKSGRPAVLLLHFEFEAGGKSDFPVRVVVYRMRLFLKYREPIYTLALLLDPDPEHRPSEYVEEVFDNELRFRFTAVKLLDFAGREEEFLRSGDPAKILVAIKLVEHRIKDSAQRLAEKRRILRILVDVMRSDDDQRALTRLLIEGIMMSEAHTAEFHDDVMRVEQEQAMPFTTIYERQAEERGRAIGEEHGRAIGEEHGRAIGEQRGRAIGEEHGRAIGEEHGRAIGEARATLRERRDAIIRILRARFSDVPTRLIEQVQSIEDLARLEDLLVRAAVAPSASEFASALS